MADVDIDFADRDSAVSFIKHIPASTVNNGKMTKHVVGIYVQNIPTDPLTGYSSIPHEEAESYGYFKIDFLNLNVYKHITSNSDLERLLNTPPDWSLLEYEEIVGMLDQLGNNFKIVDQMKPKSIEQLAMVLALIRPAKKHLVGQPWDVIEKNIWIKPSSGYYFKKSHAVAYAHVIVVQMNLISEGHYTNGNN